MNKIKPLAILLVVVIGGLLLVNESKWKIAEVSIVEIVQKINNDEVKEIKTEADGDKIEIVLRNDIELLSHKDAENSLTETLVNNGVDREKLKNLSISIKEISSINVWLGNILAFLIPIVIIYITPVIILFGIIIFIVKKIRSYLKNNSQKKSSCTQ